MERGHYDFDMVARTEETRLNVFDGWRPRLSAATRGADILFLGAMDPEVQLDVRGQWDGPKWVALDTLGYWIEQSRKMAYKASFRPIEGLGPGGWRRLHLD